MMRFPLLSRLGIILTLVLFPFAGIGQEVPTGLQKEMPYSQARKLILEAGWQKVQSRNPHENNRLIGSLHRMVNELNYDEFEDCAGTGEGLCLANFIDGKGRKLAVVTANNEQDPILYRWWIEQAPHNQ